MNLVGIPGQIGKTTLRGYSLTVDGKNMDAYVDAGSMRPLRSRAEGEKLWEYWSEIMRVELDVDCFGILGIDSTSYTTLYKKRAQLWFNNKVILDGSLGEPEYDWDTQRLTIEIQSLGRILKDIKIDSNFENRVLRGDTAENAVNALIYLFINPQLEAAGYPLRAAGSSVNVVDFSFYKSLDFANNNIVGSFSIFYNGARYYIDNNVNRPTAIYTDASGNAWLGRSLIIDERDFLYLIKITESGVSATQKIVLDGDYLEARPEFITDQSVIEFIKKFLSNHALISVVKINDTYFALSVLQSSMRAWFSKIVVDPTDYYIYKFEAGASVTDILRKFAIMTNSVYHAGESDNKIYFQNREDGVATLDLKSPINLKSKLVVKQGTFEVPEEFTVLEDVKSDLVSYYNTFLQGKWRWVQAVFAAEQFSDSDKPLMLKKLPIAGIQSSGGLVNFVEPAEDYITIETEEYLNG